ncbi:hypothetical protein CcaverHIS002_0401630 [Cutaneotrichosporon cavernicola]|uniref:Uncharacterized protein n=1 Tax=Cutaneotrichosporon cavernicola TaxID=279322 RepID=A0AA48L3L0_9TREE|nr:uncharacterized protein CcaverHIS019_0401590 [Cutaneotrichosporon cavernicola]BEI83559.1 hypothetical protein CcaverHIS002_0401630 [Cutaneotrichosporon cavernicola]BEI91339.1 hypothetical protein CcaverHIS019_0401590 [Cutaneotrichosporon cavernicola]BEI99112.1 hypothetical protein CcaverHIS631_0401550 [Cutaneotrichosporon cavernicola]BEJ06886.1 hypothetical protein CcaverHIS641_0401550 [Cutaneotrichosporon cavernicola]
MDANSNLHGFDTPDALPTHRDRQADSMRTESLLRESMTRVEDMTQTRDLDKDGDDRRRSFNGGVEEMLNVLADCIASE